MLYERMSFYIGLKIVYWHYLKISENNIKNDKFNNKKNTVAHSKKYSKQIKKTNDKLGRISATHNPDKGLISFINK